MKHRKLRKNLLAASLGACLMAMLPVSQAFANDGALIGRVSNVGAGSTVTVRNLATGLERSVAVDAAGNYRFPFLPVGDYLSLIHI
jgi:hypothetical protein